MSFFAIPNLSSQLVTPVIPWQVDRVVPSEVMTDKARFVEWCTNPATKNCHYSAFEGIDPHVRVGTSNSPCRMHALIADYDSKITDRDVRDLRRRSKSEFFPNHACRTFSGGMRLVWELEQPVNLPDNRDAVRNMFAIIKKALGMDKLLPGFDDGAFHNLAQYYEVGFEWQHLSTDTIPEAMVWLWLAKAGENISFSRNRHPVPLNIVAEEVRKRFPGRWDSAFEEGNRGPRFWDPSADNRTSAVVRLDGMQCFTGGTSFMTWRDIFGNAFVDKHVADSFGDVVANTYYDGTKYWRPAAKSLDEGWIANSKEDFKLHLKVQHSMSATAGRKETASEVERTMHQIQKDNLIEAAIPSVHHRPGLIHHNGRRFLNISQTRVVMPAERSVAQWGDGFPWIAEFLDGFFDPPESKEYFLAWLRWFYVNALHFNPQSGQAIFIAGDAGLGKTLLSTALISPMMGGHQDASDFLVEGESFNDYILESPLLTLDDCVACATRAGQTRYSATIKKLIANRHFVYKKKFEKTGQVSWQGRVVVTMNCDPESLRLLPSIEMSNLDKVSFFKVLPGPRKFSGNVGSTIKAELPFFCRWLLDWEVPPHCAGDDRFGVVAYHESTLYQLAAQAESSFSFLELLAELRRRIWESERSDPKWDGNWYGTTTQLISLLLATPDLEPVARSYSDVRTASRELGKLSAWENPIVFPGKLVGTARVWVLVCNPRCGEEDLWTGRSERAKSLHVSVPSSGSVSRLSPENLR